MAELREIRCKFCKVLLLKVHLAEPLTLMEIKCRRRKCEYMNKFAFRNSEEILGEQGLTCWRIVEEVCITN